MPELGRDTTRSANGQKVYYIDDEGDRSNYLVIDPKNKTRSDWNLMLKIAEKVGLKVSELVKKLDSGEKFNY
jgi:hypothetical protein